jgi:hypothetical protein
MQVGTKVVRNPRYKWCVCEKYPRTTPGCWCRVKGQVMEVVATENRYACQSGTMVVVMLGGKSTDWVDSSYFQEVLL